MGDRDILQEIKTNPVYEQWLRGLKQAHPGFTDAQFDTAILRAVTRLGKNATPDSVMHEIERAFADLPAPPPTVATPQPVTPATKAALEKAKPAPVTPPPTTPPTEAGPVTPTTPTGEEKAPASSDVDDLMASPAMKELKVFYPKLTDAQLRQAAENALARVAELPQAQQARVMETILTDEMDTLSAEPKRFSANTLVKQFEEWLGQAPMPEAQKAQLVADDGVRNRWLQQWMESGGDVSWTDYLTSTVQPQVSQQVQQAQTYIRNLEAQAKREPTKEEREQQLLDMARNRGLFQDTATPEYEKSLLSQLPEILRRAKSPNQTFETVAADVLSRTPPQERMAAQVGAVPPAANVQTARAAMEGAAQRRAQQLTAAEPSGGPVAPESVPDLGPDLISEGAAQTVQNIPSGEGAYQDVIESLVADIDEPAFQDYVRAQLQSKVVAAFSQQREDVLAKLMEPPVADRGTFTTMRPSEAAIRERVAAGMNADEARQAVEQAGLTETVELPVGTPTPEQRLVLARSKMESPVQGLDKQLQESITGLNRDFLQEQMAKRRKVRESLGPLLRSVGPVTRRTRP